MTTMGTEMVLSGVEPSSFWGCLLLTVHGPETRAVTLIYRDESLALCAPEELSPGSTVIIG